MERSQWVAVFLSWLDHLTEEFSNFQITSEKTLKSHIWSQKLLKASPSPWNNNEKNERGGEKDENMQIHFDNTDIDFVLLLLRLDAGCYLLQASVRNEL